MPLRFTLRQLEYLVAVGEAGSIAGAAQRVAVSSPSISAGIAQLEQAFGLQLFVRRHAQGLSLTRAGHQVLAEARRALAAAAALNTLAHDIAGTVRGPLSIGCLLTFADVMLAQVRRGFCDRYPEVDLRQSEGDQAAILEGIRTARLDVAFTYDLDIPTDLSFIALRTLPAYAVLGADHPLAARPSVTPQDLAPHPMILLELPSSTDYFLRIFAAHEQAPRIAERTRDMGVMRSMVANGFGYSVANIRPAATVAPDGKPLYVVPLIGPPPLRLGLVLAEGGNAPLTVRAFIDHCRQTLGDRAGPPPAAPRLRTPAP